jgi:RNase adaptor protein for sRNA GlmZ degradation
MAINQIPQHTDSQSTKKGRPSWRTTGPEDEGPARPTPSIPNRPQPKEDTTIMDTTAPHVETIEITSFGYLHGEPPAAEITLDLRTHFRDPHFSPELRYLTAHDQAVRDAVRSTPGITELAAAAAAAVDAYTSGPSATGKALRVATGCAGGRHRAASVALEVADVLTTRGYRVCVIHRDLDKPVVER